MATADTGAGAGAFGVWLNQNHSRGDADADLGRPVRTNRWCSSGCSPTSGTSPGCATVCGRWSSWRAGDETARDHRAARWRRENAALFAVLDNDSELDDHLLATVGDSQHGTSTCRMGASGRRRHGGRPAAAAYSASTACAWSTPRSSPPCPAPTPTWPRSWSASSWPTGSTEPRPTHAPSTRRGAPPDEDPAEPDRRHVGGLARRRPSWTWSTRRPRRSSPAIPAARRTTSTARWPRRSRHSPRGRRCRSPSASPGSPPGPTPSPSTPTELAELECREMGKPLGIGRTFIDGAVAGLRAAAAEALSYAFEETVVRPDGGRTQILRHPLGATAVITPWNFPVTAVLGATRPAAGGREHRRRQALGALAAVDRAAVRAAGPAARRGQPGARRCTGRSAAGRARADPAGALHRLGRRRQARSARRQAERLHRAVLELGGKDPVVVDAGSRPGRDRRGRRVRRLRQHRADLHVDGAHLRAPRRRRRRSSTRWWPRPMASRSGNGLDEGVVLGPLVDERQRDIVVRHVADAVAEGCDDPHGRRRPRRQGLLLPAHGPHRRRRLDAGHDRGDVRAARPGRGRRLLRGGAASGRPGRGSASPPRSTPTTPTTSPRPPASRPASSGSTSGRAAARNGSTNRPATAAWAPPGATRPTTPPPGRPSVHIAARAGTVAGCPRSRS